MSSGKRRSFCLGLNVIKSDLAKSRSREIVCREDRVALKFNSRRFDSTAVEMPAEFQSDRTILNPYLVASIRHEICW